MPLQICRHPLAAHLLADLRDVETEPAQFRRAAKLLSTLLILEATAGMAQAETTVRTPLEATPAHRLAGGLAVVPILRAGLSMLESALDLFPDVAVGYIGLERSHETAVASSYYSKLPNLTGRKVLCVDPMLATGGSASQALSLLKTHGATDLALVCVVAAPEGVAVVESTHPDVPITVAALDRELNASKYILPGLGDYGDRLYGTS